MGRGLFTRSNSLSRSRCRTALACAILASVASCIAAASAFGAAPVNIANPKVTGQTIQGSVLRAHPGRWKNVAASSRSFHWIRCDRRGRHCRLLQPAFHRTYVPRSEDRGRRLKVLVTYKNGDGVRSAVSRPSRPIRLMAAPKVRISPAVAGEARVDDQLRARVGSWSSSGRLIKYVIQWVRCDASGAACKVIPGATSATYVAHPDDEGATLRVRVSARNAARFVTATSRQSAPIAPRSPVNLSLPRIVGSAAEGGVLSTDAGSWLASGSVVKRYQWLRCDLWGYNCSEIADAASLTYEPVGDDVGRVLRVRVFAHNQSGETMAESYPSHVIEPLAPSNVSPPVVSGTARDTQELTVEIGSWRGTQPLSFRYAWQRCGASGTQCADIADATAASYRLTPDDVGEQVRVVVTARNQAGSASAASSTTSVVQPDPPANLVAPVISGTERDTEQLTATSGTWSGTPTVSHSYQWQRCDAGSGVCADIASSAAPNYTLTPSDVGFRMRVRVRASNAAGTADAFSALSGIIAANPPENTSLPVLSGIAQENERLIADEGSWTGTPTIVYSYEWLRCDSGGDNCSAISGQQNSYYDLSGSDVGSRIRLTVTATNAGGSATATTAATDIVSAATPVGTVLAFGGTTLPSGWLWADGSAVSRSTYSQLFETIGVAYGAGNGSTTFAVPNLTGRAPLGKAASGTGSTLGVSLGGSLSHGHSFSVGSHSHTFSIPSHTHSLGAFAAHDHTVPHTNVYADWHTGEPDVATRGQQTIRTNSQCGTGCSAGSISSGGSGIMSQPTDAKTATATSSNATFPYQAVNYIVKAQSTATTPCGAIWPTANASASSGTLLADGSAVSRSTYSSLFSCIGTAFGTGDGSTTFGVPNLRQRFAVGRAATGIASTLGESGGSIDHTHTNQVAATTHSVSFGNHSHSATEPSYTHSVTYPNTNWWDNDNNNTSIAQSGSVGTSSGGGASVVNNPSGAQTVTTSNEGNASQTTAASNPPFVALNFQVATDSSYTIQPGTMTAFAGSAAPSGWLLADGSVVSRSTYAALFAAIGTTYGSGDGSTTFKLPDLRQRFPLGKAATGTGSTLGASGGAIDHSYTWSVPGHTHTATLANSSHSWTFSNHTHTVTSPSTRFPLVMHPHCSPLDGNWYDGTCGYGVTPGETVTTSAGGGQTVSSNGGGEAGVYTSGSGGSQTVSTSAANLPLTVVNYLIKH